MSSYLHATIVYLNTCTHAVSQLNTCTHAVSQLNTCTHAVSQLNKCTHAVSHAPTVAASNVCLYYQSIASLELFFHNPRHVHIRPAPENNGMGLGLWDCVNSCPHPGLASCNWPWVNIFFSQWLMIDVTHVVQTLYWVQWEEYLCKPIGMLTNYIADPIP